MSIAFQRRLLISAAALLALAIGSGIAEETYGLAAVAGIGGLSVLLWRLSGVPVDALAAGLVLFGYIAGNRGFAQLHPPGVPLLPAEFALGLGLAFLGIRCAINRRLPLQVAPLDLTVIIFLLIGTIRFVHDFPMHGFLAARDFAMVYYAGFFFLAKDWAKDERVRRWLRGCLLVGLLVLGPLWVLSVSFPSFFLGQLTVWGAPLIYFKGDVGAALLAAGAVWMTASAAHGRAISWLLAGALSAAVAVSNSRAALLALGVAGAGAVLLRWWAFVRVQAVVAIAGLALLLLWAGASPRPFTQSRVYLLMESIASIADTEGARTFRSVALSDKPDNNQFRLMWWRTVRDETLALNPVLGLGFGYDLADSFQRIYQPEASDDFTARSPHSYPITVFGRMGAVGLLALCAVLAAIAWETWQANRRDPARTGSWLMIWTIFVSACFGVVLEGPMGAVVFWTLLGLANGSAVAIPTPAVAESPAAPDPLPLARSRPAGATPRSADIA